MFKLTKQTLTITILTSLILVVYVALMIYATANQSTISKITEKQIVALDPSLKTEVVDRLKEALTFSEEELNMVTASKSSTLTTKPR